MKTMISCISLAGLVASCALMANTVAVADVTRSELITIKKHASQGYVHALSISGSGNLHGAAKITLDLDHRAYKVENLSGKLRFHWTVDWYSDQATIRYQPTSVKGGQLSLRYQFQD